MSGASSPADHFSSVSAAYSAFRPRYPAALIDYFASLAPRRRIAWDCGAGSGQATADIARHFEFVVATDLSADQLARASKNPSVGWAACSAERRRDPIQLDRRDRGRAGAALVRKRRVLRGDQARRERLRCADRRVDIRRAAHGRRRRRSAAQVHVRRHRGSYWPPERKYVDSEYRTIPFPFERIDTPPFALENDWTLPQVVGYMRSMSATSRYMKANGVDPVVAVGEELLALWQDGAPRRIVWPVIVLAGRVAS